MKPVLVTALLLAVLALVHGEGSGEAWSDLEDDDELSDMDDGSGDMDVFDAMEEEETLEQIIRLNEVGIQADKFDLVDMDYPLVYEEDYAYTDFYGPGEESVLRIEEETVNDIEIGPKPGSDAGERAILQTSQIFIMVGSAFISFTIFILTFFFVCRRMVMKKQEKKMIPFTVVTDRKNLKESSIVKDYQKVPTTTQQLLQNSHKELHAGDTNQENPSSVPLVQ